jgi:GNAT superfamily N-acetyltransferase
LESSGIPLADEKITLSKTPTHVADDPDFFSPSLPNPGLHEIFITSGNHSRFKTDPVFRPYFQKLYTLWMQNALNRTFADHFLCTGTPDEPTGLITLQNHDTALHISIIAVAQHAQGTGLGRRLVQKAESIAHHLNFPTLTVDTQGANHSALAFYQKMRFSPLTRVFVYHWHSA